MQHVRARKGTANYYFQRLVRIPFDYCLSCNLTNECHENVKAAGFDKVVLDVFEADELIYPKPIVMLVNLVTPHVSGVATK